jgi:hypothetical protein
VITDPAAIAAHQGVERGASVTEAGHRPGSEQPEPVYGRCAQMIARGMTRVDGPILALIPGRQVQLGPRLATRACRTRPLPPPGGVARQAVASLLKETPHTPLEQDRNRNSLAGGATLVKIVALDHPRAGSSYQAGLAVTDGEHPTGAGAVRWPHIAEYAPLAALIAGSSAARRSTIWKSTG